MIAIFALLGKILPFIRIIGAISGVLGVIYYFHYSGVVSEQNKQNKAAVEQVERNDKIKARIMGMSCDDVHKQLRKFYGN